MHFLQKAESSYILQNVCKTYPVQIKQLDTHDQQIPQKHVNKLINYCVIKTWYSLFVCL